MARQPQGGLRALKALVGIMGVLIVLGTALVIGVVIHRLYARVSPVPSMAVPLGEAAALAPGEHIAGVAGAGGDVAIWVEGPAGGRVLLLDPATGRLCVALSAPR